MQIPREEVRVPIPTSAGEFEVRAFRAAAGHIYLALVKGSLGDGRGVLARIHSECLTGDILGSLRCDCGLQLRHALRAVAAEGRGVVLYATGQEGRGIGLINKLRAYVLQDEGLDTVDANRALGLPVDRRSYREASLILHALGVRSVRLMTNNPRKAAGLRDAGIAVDEVLPLATSAHSRNVAYLRTKRERLAHVTPGGRAVAAASEPAVDASTLLGRVRSPSWRPYVVLKYAQTLDGRIATRVGDSRWISGEEERRVSHALRAASDAVAVGVGTVIADDPHLSVRMVLGASPIRVVLDSTVRIPMDARVLDDHTPTIVLTTRRASPRRRALLHALGARVGVMPAGAGGVDLRAGLRWLRVAGIRSLLVEGGASVITSLLAEGLVDRMIVGVAPMLVGSGVEAVGDLGVGRVADAVRLHSPTTYRVAGDLLIAGDIERAGDADPAPQAAASSRATLPPA